MTLNSSYLSLYNLGAKSRSWISLFIGNFPSFTQKLKKLQMYPPPPTPQPPLPPKKKKISELIVLESLHKSSTVVRFACAEFFYFIKYTFNTTNT